MSPPTFPVSSPLGPLACTVSPSPDLNSFSLKQEILRCLILKPAVQQGIPLIMFSLCLAHSHLAQCWLSVFVEFWSPMLRMVLPQCWPLRWSSLHSKWPSLDVGSGIPGMTSRFPWDSLLDLPSFSSLSSCVLSVWDSVSALGTMVYLGLARRSSKEVCLLPRDSAQWPDSVAVTGPPGQ